MAKGRALAYRLGRRGDEGGDQLVDRPYQDVCGAWWAEVQRLARAEGAATRVLEYSFLSDDELAVWVVSGETGELLCSKVVSSTSKTGRSISQVLAEVRSNMNVRGRDAMRDARNHRGRQLSYLLYLLKRGQEYARGLKCAHVRPRGQNLRSQTAPAQPNICLPGLFAKIPTEIFSHVLLPRLDLTSLMNFLCSCKFFRDLDVMHPQLTAARFFIIDTALEQINILDACKLDLEMILSNSEIIQDWMIENDGKEQGEEAKFFDCWMSKVLQYASEEVRDQRREQTCTSFWEYLGSEKPDFDNDDNLHCAYYWYTDKVESVMEEIRDEVLDSSRQLPNPAADHLTEQTRQVFAALSTKTYASLTCSQTGGSSYSVLDQIQHEIAQRQDAAKYLIKSLEDVNEEIGGDRVRLRSTLLFHSILSKLYTGELRCVEEWIAKYGDGETKYGDGEMEEESPTAVAQGAPTRAKPSGAEREDSLPERETWALRMLQSLLVGGGGRGKVKETWEEIRKEKHAEKIRKEQHAEKMATSLLKELYQVLIAPIKTVLEGAEELLIVPHKELFEIPWAALTDFDGHYLIKRHVIRTAPSLRVARQAADKMQQHAKQSPGHVVLIGNPHPIRAQFHILPFAEKEVKDIKEILVGAKVVLHSKHIYYGSNPTRPPTKTNVKESLEGAAWPHLACHADLDTGALVLAICGSTDQDSDLTMQEVQGIEGAQGVQLAHGATVVLSACNTGRGEIKAEGVLGLARAFLFANASAIVVSLWSVDDGSTAVLMSIMYKHLAEGCTVPQALRLAMLELMEQEEWKRPMHWAGFLVVGASTRLTRDGVGCV
jgi:CHAT domain-containing protein